MMHTHWQQQQQQRQQQQQANGDGPAQAAEPTYATVRKTRLGQRRPRFSAVGRFSRASSSSSDSSSAAAAAVHADPRHDNGRHHYDQRHDLLLQPGRPRTIRRGHRDCESDGDRGGLGSAARSSSETHGAARDSDGDSDSDRGSLCSEGMARQRAAGNRVMFAADLQGATSTDWDPGDELVRLPPPPTPAPRHRHRRRSATATAAATAATTMATAAAAAAATGRHDAEAAAALQKVEDEIAATMHELRRLRHAKVAPRPGLSRKQRQKQRQRRRDPSEQHTAQHDVLG